MKRFLILPMLLSAVLACFSCEKDDDLNGGGGGRISASFRKVDLSGAWWRRWPDKRFFPQG